MQRFLDSLVVDFSLLVLEGSIPNRGPRYTKDVKNGTSSSVVSTQH